MVVVVAARSVVTAAFFASTTVSALPPPPRQPKQPPPPPPFFFGPAVDGAEVARLLLLLFEGGAVAGANASDPPALADALEGRLRAPLESCRGAIAAAREGSMNNGSGRGDGSAECEIWLALDGDTSIDLGAAGSAAVKEGDGVIVNVTAADGGVGWPLRACRFGRAVVARQRRAAWLT